MSDQVIVARVWTSIAGNSTVDADFIDHDFVFNLQPETRELIINADGISNAIGVKNEALVNSAASELKGEIKKVIKVFLKKFQ